MPPTITTHGSGSAEHAPDAMVLRMAAVAVAPSVTEALGQVADLVSRVGDAARATEPGVTVGSTGLQVWQQRDSRGAPAGFEARHSLRVACPVLNRAGAVVDALSSALGDAFVLDGIEPRISDPERLGVEARARAFADAEAKAEELASLSGARLGRVVAVVEGGPGGVAPRPMGKAMMASADTAFEPGTQAVGATISVTWEISEG